MKKSIFLSIILFVLSFTVSAQTGSVFNKIGERGSRDRSNSTIIGIKAGIVVPKMLYNNEEFNDIVQDILLKPSFGLFVDFPLTNSLSIAPEFLYTSRGVSHADFIYRNKYDASFVLMANYIDLKIPFIYRFKVSNFIHPYIFAAADMAMCLNATEDYVIDYESSVIDIHDNLSIGRDYNMYDLGVTLGLGFRFNFNFKRFSIVTKVDAAYNIGLLDTYGAEVLHTVDPDLQRYNRPIELMLSIGLPLKFSQPDACSTFNGKYDKYF